MTSNHLKDRVKAQLSRGELVLFTGAGFSVSATNIQGNPVPTPSELRHKLWELCFPDESPDEISSLGELYELASRRHANELKALMTQNLTVDADSLPDFYQIYLSYPWHRIYTLNVDDLEVAAVRKWDFDRPPRPIIATGSSRHDPSPHSCLEVIHLNGMIPDRLSNLTFSERQYARRVANEEPLYSQCVSDIMARPTIFVGTTLNEVTLWQHIELRRRETISGRDLRPSSVLVSPALSAARHALLEELKMEWIEATAEQFAEEFLVSIGAEANRGFTYIRDKARLSGHTTVPLVSQLASERPTLDTDYLLGAEPHWSDLLSGRAIERSNDQDLIDLAHSILSGDEKPSALAVTGTAGTGKSTALMRLGLYLSQKAIPCLWVDKDSEASPKLIRQKIWSVDAGPLAVLIDDADLFGHHLPNMVNDFVQNREELLFAFAVRAGKLDRISEALGQAQVVSLEEHVVPHLTDDDIEGLIEALDKANRLGVLKGLSDRARRDALKEQAGRQLLVAMIQATSGRDFEEKVLGEMEELKPPQEFIYGLICLASNFRHYLTKQEILLAVGGDVKDDTLFALDRLVARHIVRADPPLYYYKARHRLIATIAFNQLQSIGKLAELIEALAFTIASKATPGPNRNSRHWRLLKALINHSFLLRNLTPNEASSIYRSLEEILSWDYHYWLQRGSLEVEAGDLRLAQNFLDQAKSLAPEDYRIETEYGYLLLRQAQEEKSNSKAEELFNEGISLLEDIIVSHGQFTPYPFHILAVQGTTWIQEASIARSEQLRLLDRLMHSIERGLRLHPLSLELQQAKSNLERQRLMTVVHNHDN